MAIALLGPDATPDQIQAIVEAIARQRDPGGMRAMQGNEGAIRSGYASDQRKQALTQQYGGMSPHQDSPRFLGIQPRFEGPPLTEHEGNQRNMSVFMSDIAPSLMSAIPGAAQAIRYTPSPRTDAFFRPKIGGLDTKPNFGPTSSVMRDFRPHPGMTAGHRGSVPLGQWDDAIEPSITPIPGHTPTDWSLKPDQVRRMTPSQFYRRAGWQEIKPEPQVTNSMRRPLPR